MRNTVFLADLNQIEQLWVHSDQVHAEWLVRQLSSLADLGVEQLGRHRPASNHTETASVRDS